TAPVSLRVSRCRGHRAANRRWSVCGRIRDQGGQAFRRTALGAAGGVVDENRGSGAEVMPPSATTAQLLEPAGLFFLVGTARSHPKARRLPIIMNRPRVAGAAAMIHLCRE